MRRLTPRQRGEAFRLSNPHSVAALTPSFEQPLWLTMAKGAGALASFVFLARLAWRVAAVTIAEGYPILVPVALVLGYASADLVSGTVHWFCDTFFSPRTPIVGRVIFRFRDHHDHPQTIVELGFLEQDINNLFLPVPLLAWLWWRDLPATGRPGVLFGAAFLLALSLGTSATNLFHKWAHHPTPPAIARWLQRSGLIQTPERHWVHHRDHSRAFCVTSGWMNRLLDPIRFFPRLERGVRWLMTASFARSAAEVERR
jgi:ubiquitin-conjugating enzyme E2 variant